MEHPKEIQNLIECLSRLPGLGRKSATRLALYFLKQPTSEAQMLASALINLKESIHFCSVCHDYTNQDPCPRCRDPQRDHGIICVVETPADLLVIESIGAFRGVYHVLGGTLNPLAGIGPDDLNIDDLCLRIKPGNETSVREILLATGSSPEGESTASYILDRLKNTEVKVTKLARGLPVGMNLEFVDGSTLKQALEFRQNAR
ncbi:MAG: recombination mediator RecR [Deltaproteobacteria bacterium]|nr:recombination mediator RecR [Deltaproteobacteria bacterium]